MGERKFRVPRLAGVLIIAALLALPASSAAATLTEQVGPDPSSTVLSGGLAPPSPTCTPGAPGQVSCVGYANVALGVLPPPFLSNPVPTRVARKGQVTGVSIRTAAQPAVSDTFRLIAGPGTSDPFLSASWRLNVRATSAVESAPRSGAGPVYSGNLATPFPVQADEFLGITAWTGFTIKYADNNYFPPAIGAYGGVNFSGSSSGAFIYSQFNRDSSVSNNLLIRFDVAWAPASLTAPTSGATGTPEEGTAITGGTDGTWDSSPTSYAYQWLRCDGAGANCSAISGANLIAYTPVPGDVGSTLRLQVIASNVEGGPSDPAQSAATAVVAAAPTPPGPGPGPGPGPDPFSGPSAAAGVSAPAPNTAPDPEVTVCTPEKHGDGYSQETKGTEEAHKEYGDGDDGDEIIPPYDYVKADGSTGHYDGQNWDKEGKATLNSGCEPPGDDPVSGAYDPPAKSKVTFCQGSSNGEYSRESSDPEEYVREVKRGEHERDVVAPFSYNGGEFPGLNWDEAGRGIFANGCQAPEPITNPSGDPAERVSYCHYAGNGVYTREETTPGRVTDPDKDEKDIVPPYTTVTKSSASKSTAKAADKEKHSGRNWDEEGQAIFNNGCVVPAKSQQAGPVTPKVTCIEASSDKTTYTAYFGYSNAGAREAQVDQGSDNAITLSGASGATISGPPTEFRAGAEASAAKVTNIPAAGSASWTITYGGKTTTVTATSASDQCRTAADPVDFGLFAACTEKGSGSYSVTFGYQNDNVVPVSTPLGRRNRVLIDGSGGDLNRGQPAELGVGRNESAFTVSNVKNGDEVVWEVTVGGKEHVARASKDTPACQGGASPVVTEQPVGPTVRCVARNADGTYDAVFGYSNLNEVTVEVPAGSANYLSLSPGTKAPGPQTRGQPTAFEPGSSGDAFFVRNVPAGQEVTWTISAQGTRTATAGIAFPVRCSWETPEPTPSDPIPKPEPVPPTINLGPDPSPPSLEGAVGVYLSCVDVSGSTYSATFGYSNPGSTELTIPVGADNTFAGSPADRGQPTVFAPGMSSEAFRVTGIALGRKVTWRVTGPNGETAEAVADAAAPNCTTSNTKIGPTTNVTIDPPSSVPESPSAPIETEVENPGTTTDWAPLFVVDVPDPLTPTGVSPRTPGTRCRIKGGAARCRAVYLLPGQKISTRVKAKAKRKGRSLPSVAGAVRRGNSRYTRFSSTTWRTTGRGPGFAG